MKKYDNFWWTTYSNISLTKYQLVLTFDNKKIKKFMQGGFCPPPCLIPYVSLDEFSWDGDVLQLYRGGYVPLSSFGNVQYNIHFYIIQYLNQVVCQYMYRVSHEIWHLINRYF